MYCFEEILHLSSLNLNGLDNVKLTYHLTVLLHVYNVFLKDTKRIKKDANTKIKIYGK